MNTLPFVGLLAVAALAGCSTTVALPEPAHTPRVALFYMLTNHPTDSSFQRLYAQRQLFVSNSQRVFAQRAPEGRADATVELRNAAGGVVERYRSVGAGSYRPMLRYQPQPGQPYTLRATLPGLAPVESTLTLPQPLVIESGTYTPRATSTGNANEFRGRLSLIVRDDPAEANYYLAYARFLNQQGQPVASVSPVEVDDDSQGSTVGIGQFQLSSPHESDSQYPFADTDVNGQRLSLNTDVRFNRSCLQCPALAFLEVHVSSITRDAYDFYLSRRRYDESNGNPFAEPAPLASNVRPGYGLFGGATDVTYRIRL